jgi:hypothetical protein
MSGLAIGLSPLPVSIPQKAVPSVVAQAPSQGGGTPATGLQPNYSGASTATLSVDQKLKISALSEKLVALFVKGDVKGASALVEKEKDFVNSPGVMAALQKQVDAGVQAKQDSDQGFMGKYGELMILAARAVIEGLNHRQSDAYWDKLGNAIKGVATPAAKSVSIPGLSE